MTVSTDLSNLFILVGKILNARESYLHTRKMWVTSYGDALKDLQKAKSEVDSSRHYNFEEDHNTYVAAQERVIESLRAREVVISMEKHYKKLKHEFRESYPNHGSILTDHLNTQTTEIQKKMRGK